MSITRRTMVRSLAALSALPLASGFVGHSLAEATGHGAQVTPPSIPDTTSIFVIFEGPWVIDQPDITDATLRAVTFGELESPWTSIHHCPVGFGIPGSYSLDNIPDSHKIPMSLPLQLEAGERWSIAPNAGYSLKNKKITDPFDPRYGRSPKDPFVYVKGTNMTVMPKQNDRTVTLPIPDAAYVSGQLSHCKVQGANLAGGSASTSHPYAAVILEYKTLGGTPGLTLFPSGTLPLPIVPGKHLVFRMTHSDSISELQHVHAAHETLRKRIRSWSADGSELELGLTVTDKPMASLGPNSDGFEMCELGIAPVDMPKSGGAGYGDCCGGSIVLAG